ncbi:MAG: hypothetical protein RR907_15325, partial [Comamonas sp.]
MRKQVDLSFELFAGFLSCVQCRAALSKTQNLLIAKRLRNLPLVDENGATIQGFADRSKQK